MLNAAMKNLTVCLPSRDASQRPAQMTQLAAAAVPADDNQAPSRREDAPQREPRMPTGHVDDQVVALALPREILPRVVEHEVGSEVTCLLQVAGAADGGDVPSERLRDLDGERPNPAGRAVDQHPLARLQLALVPETLQRGEPGDAHRGGLLERDVGRLADDVDRAHILGKGAAAAAEDLVTRSEVGDIVAHGLYHSREVGAEEHALRAQHAVSRDGPQEARETTQLMQVGLVQRARADTDEHSVIGQLGRVDLLDAHHSGPAVRMPNKRLHHRPLLHTP